MEKPPFADLIPTLQMWPVYREHMLGHVAVMDENTRKWKWACCVIVPVDGLPTIGEILYDNEQYIFPSKEAALIASRNAITRQMEAVKTMCN